MLEQSTPEEWRAVPGYEGRYEVSDLGRVRRVGRDPLKPWLNHHGYPEVGLTRPPLHRKNWRVHKLVALTFIGLPPTPKHEVNHKDAVKINCRATNLEWLTHSENLRHAIGLGRRTYPRYPRGKTHHKAKLTIDDVRAIRALREKGVSNREVANLYNVRTEAITDITRGHTWRNFD